MVSMRKILSALCITAFLAFTISSCRKGCTDKNALNYNASAKADDQSCLYNGSVVFWYDSLQYTGAIVVRMADSTEGHIRYDVTGAGPSCGAARYFTYTAAPGIYAYTAFLTDTIRGSKADTGMVTISSGQCAIKDIPF
jgi:hypothetical protein